LQEGNLNNSGSGVRKNQKEVIATAEDRKGNNSDSESCEEKLGQMVTNKITTKKTWFQWLRWRRQRDARKYCEESKSWKRNDF
jgi:UDP-glucose 4-epimerase